MGFKKLFASVGFGSAGVDTVVHEPNVVPGGVVQGEVRFEGGAVDQKIQSLTVGLMAQVEVETSDGERRENIQFGRQQLGGALHLQQGEGHVVPFQLAVPWETPISALLGHQLTGMKLGVFTELAIAHAVDSTDLDPIQVHALPAQQSLLDAFGQLGFTFHRADLEKGHIHGTRQQLPFYQEIEFHAPPQYRGLNQVELTFISDGTVMDVVMEADKKGGLLSEGSDSYHAFHVDLADFRSTDWTGYVNQWLTEVGSRRNWL